MSDPRPEVTIEPTHCVWMGDNPEWDQRWEIGHAYRLDSWIDHSTHWAGVRPIIVQCPVMLHWIDGRHPDRLSSTQFNIYSYPTPDDDKPIDPAAHWEVDVDESSLVIGQKPIITVSPSIHLVGIWHGWLQDGVLHQ